MALSNVLNQQVLHIHLWQEDEGYFVAKCIDIPGCVSEGDTREEALANIHDAISSCLSVIEEDSQKVGVGISSFEVIERPMQNFMAAGQP